MNNTIGKPTVFPHYISADHLFANGKRVSETENKTEIVPATNNIDRHAQAKERKYCSDIKPVSDGNFLVKSNQNLKVQVICETHAALTDLHLIYK